MAIKTYPAKTILFREGEVGDAAYIIESGQVEILKSAEHGEVQLAVLEAGDVLGEIALFEPKNTRSATARALTEVTVDAIMVDEFDALLAQTPEQMQVMIAAIISRLRDTNQRLAAKERVSVVLDGAIERITVRPADDALNFAPITLQATNLPFTIGGYPQGEENPRHNDLDLPSDGPPLIVSQKHLKLERREGGVFVVDQGSRFCTIVNGMVIGRGKVDTSAQLHLGENKITLGDYKSPYRLMIECE